MPLDIRESFYVWLQEHEGIDFDFETWAKMLEAHDDFPLFIAYQAGVAFRQREEAKSLHVRFTHSKTAFRYPPEPFIKKLKRFLGIGPKGSPFVKLEKEK